MNEDNKSNHTGETIDRDKFGPLTPVDLVSTPLIHDPNEPPTILSYKDYGDPEVVEIEDIQIEGAPYVNEETAQAILNNQKH